MSSILVTGCLGRLGSRIVAACARSGSKVSGVDVMRGLFEAYAPGDRHPQRYLQADLADAGAAYAAIASFRPDIVVHAAAIPDMTHNTGHDVLKANTMSTYNIIEACLSLGVRKMVNISSLQILGIVKSDHEISRLPRFSYVPIDETHPIHPENPYAISKLFGEQLCDAATRRNPAFSAVSLRPTWCVDELNIERNLGSFVRDPEGTHSETVWSYVCLPDVADAVVRATEVQTTGHEVFYLAAADTEGGRDLESGVRHRCGDTVPVRRERLTRPDASGIDCSKAHRMLGWTPRLTWRDYLNDQGRLKQTPANGWF